MGQNLCCTAHPDVRRSSCQFNKFLNRDFSTIAVILEKLYIRQLHFRIPTGKKISEKTMKAHYAVIPVLVIVSLNLTRVTEEFSHFDPNRRPQIMGDLLPFRSINPQRKRIQNKIVLYHNYYRAKVKPLSSNMLKMKWHKETARAAQKWAESCKFLIHDTPTGRHIANYGACGQNIFIASKRVPRFFAIETWWLEKNDFKYGKKTNMSVVGHYTQLVWASSHEVGCGLAKCYQKVYDKEQKEIESKKRVFYNYVCNYCPSGNRPGRSSFPYKLGNPCSSCKKNCSKRLCLNSCQYVDTWANCKQLYKMHPTWLCNSHTPKGRQRLQYCKATCSCKNKIYD
ncbi:cysteine-rich secretory protein 2-like isoform X1 [Rhynchophorus ferrugineus]|uniref:cysteine-rich secretory protein 2-like isoform X1 n=1 Tax=Rhynchophorus ferrugineus TaxID=354439 RepID=UPI003FCD2201